MLFRSGLAEDNQNFLLMYSISVNISGQIASVIAGGLILTLMSGIAIGGTHMSFALLPTTLTMLCAGMAGIFLVLGVLVLGVYLLNKMFK